MKRQQLRHSPKSGRDFEPMLYLALLRRAENFSSGSLNWNQLQAFKKNRPKEFKSQNTELTKLLDLDSRRDSDFS